MRLRFLLAALLVSLPAAADNVLMKSNGLGAAAGAIIGATVGAAALAPPPQWKGFPDGSGDDGIHSPKADDSVGQWLRSGQKSDCVAAKPEMAGLATALKSDLPSELPPEGQIHVTQAQGAGDGHKYDSYAPDSGGQSVTCP